MTRALRLLLAIGVGCSLFAQSPAATPGTEPGSTMVNPKDGLKYVWIPPGRFQIGCSKDDAECFDPEKPGTPVTLTKGFWIGQTEVTQDAWQKVMGNNPSNFKGPNRPVENITWDDAVNYCKAAGMRLPTEAEWEYAARAGSTSGRYGEMNAISWHGGNAQGKTHDAGGKQPNAWGLYDMLGNVWEWVSDLFSLHYLPLELIDPKGPQEGSMRVRRGGAWDDAPRYARVSFRGQARTSYHFSNLGVRCAGN